jgi:hypothetical protein
LGTSGNTFSCTGWAADSDSIPPSYVFYAPRYSTADKHSHSQSIVSQYPEVTTYSSGFKYDYGSEAGKWYVTWWVKFDHVDSGGQWKKWRISPGGSWNNLDGEIEQGDFYNTTGGISQSLLMMFCDCSSYGQCYPGSNAGLRWLSGDEAVPADTWVRQEFFAEESSAPDTRDGSFEYFIHRQSEAVREIVNWDGTIITRVSGADRWRYMKFQNYWGNISGGDGTGEKIYIDDIYIQVGTQSRVEIGDADTWAACTHREIQYPTAWTEGEVTDEITVTLNEGGFSDLDGTYLYVVNSDGEYNATGYELGVAPATGATMGGNLDTVPLGPGGGELLLGD